MCLMRVSSIEKCFKKCADLAANFEQNWNDYLKKLVQEKLPTNCSTTMSVQPVKLLATSAKFHTNEAHLVVTLSAGKCKSSCGR